MSGWGTAAVAAVMVVGLIGTVVPVMPGLVVIWAAGLVYGLVAGFGPAGVTAFILMTALLIGGTIATYVLPHRAGARGGAARSSLRLGLLGGVVGFFVIPVLGLPIGAILGVLVGEHRRLGEWPAAWVTTRRVVVAFGYAIAAEFTCGLLMIGAWVVWVVVR